ncbi:kinase-like domain-containing protein [Mucidula mucida]|nr:kinase-like domain-containing protein [Mucidula mucida]
MPSKAPSGPARPPKVVTTNHVVLERGRVNQYLIMVKIGQGKNGTVYRATEITPAGVERTVAIKALKRESPEGKNKRKYNQLRRQALPRPTNHTSVGDLLHSEETKILREIAIMKKLHHPSIVQLYEVLDDRLVRTIWMVMEFCEGGEVEWHDGHGNPIQDLAQTRRILRDAIQGLEYLHTQGIIHRDIKPANLLWTKDRAHVKIADFGTAHFSYAQRLSYLGVVYDSVVDDEETRRPPQPITKAIDVWALGVTLYCLLFGEVPFHASESGVAGEFQVYRLILKGQWDVKDYMGRDKIPTGGRHPTDESSEGGIVMHLLQHLLEGDVNSRITLSEVRSNPWFLHDLPNPATWLQDTANDQILVSPQETSVAMKGVDFDLPTSDGKMSRIRRLAHNITAVFGIGAPRGTTSPNIPTPGPSRLGRNRTVADLARRKEKGKGKGADRSLSRLRNSASISRRSSQKSRKEKEVVEPETPPPSSGGLISFMFFGRGGSKSVLTPKASSSDDGDAPLPAINKSRYNTAGPSYNKSRGGAAARASAEVLGGHTAALTNSRRVSSWGDHPTELKNTSFDDDEDMGVYRQGAALSASLLPRGRASAFRASCTRWLASLTMALSLHPRMILLHQ